LGALNTETQHKYDLDNISLLVILKTVTYFPIQLVFNLLEYPMRGWSYVKFGGAGL
jgi:hypothetical protein